MTSVPFVDLQPQYRLIKREIDSAIARVFESSVFVLGREVKTFEEKFAEYTGAAFCIGVDSGTAALHVALIASEIGPGDEVIVPSNSFFATAEAVSNAGALPIFVDADPLSYTVDVQKVSAAITPRTRAIIPVHLYGQAANMGPIMELAARFKLHVIEDAAQAHGCLYQGRHVGSIGLAGCFSFYPGKNLGAYGEAGAVITNDQEVAKRVRLLRNHGSEYKYYHSEVGYNFRLDEIQAAVLNVKLEHLNDWNDLRREHAKAYADRLGNVSAGGMMLPAESPYSRHVYHIYAIQCDSRDQLQEALHAEGVQTGIHYPVPIHLQKAYSYRGFKAGDFPVAEAIARRELSLPMFPELSSKQQERVVQGIQNFFLRARM